MDNVGTFPTYTLHNIEIVPTFEMHHIGAGPTLGGGLRVFYCHNPNDNTTQPQHCSLVGPLKKAHVVN